KPGWPQRVRSNRPNFVSKPCRPASEIVRLVPRLPLDVTAHAGLLVWRNRFSPQRGVKRGAQIFSGDRNAVARTTVIKLSAIDELATLVKKVNVRRAGGMVGFGDSLRFVVEIREKVTGGFDFLP